MSTDTRTLEDIVVEALNTEYNSLGRKFGGMDPHLFTECVAEAAKLWAYSCNDDVDGARLDNERRP